MNQNVVIPDVELRDLLELFKRDTLLSVNCHAIGRVKKFNKANQTCEVQISYDKKYMEEDEFGIAQPVKKPYPLLVDIPVISLSGGESGLTFPIKAGDGCIVLFNDRDIDNWFEGKETGFVRTLRIHSISDGIAIVGIRNKNDFIQAYDDSRASLYNGSTRVAVGESKILIENSITTLNTLLQELIDEIKDIKTRDTIPGGTIIEQSISASSILKLATVATKLEGLLE